MHKGRENLMSKLASEGKLRGRRNQTRQYLEVPKELMEDGYRYAWARYTQVTGEDVSLLPEGWRPVKKKTKVEGSTPGNESDYKGLGNIVRHGDVALVCIKDEDYKENLAAKKERSASMVEGVRMRSHKGRGVSVSSDFKQETEVVG